ncbi:MAG TPA: hypothetical protein VJN70_04705 [Gemmatimonadaceae bacterium]|nr:hypothetical protein [Gemmatimonadaceae bacterium]
MTALHAGPLRPAGCRRFAALLGVLPLFACTGGGGSMAPSTFNVRFTATNDLLAPVTFLVDGSPYAILSTGVSTGLVLSSTAHVTWISAKPADSHGQPIPDEIGVVSVSVAAINGVLEITNVINDQTYITASIYNHANVPASIGVYDGVTVSCASQVPATTPTRAGFTQTGYYRLTTKTEFRAYVTPDCSGAFTAWPQSALTSFQAKSGLVTLEISTLP